MINCQGCGTSFEKITEAKYRNLCIICLVKIRDKIEENYGEILGKIKEADMSFSLMLQQAQREEIDFRKKRVEEEISYARQSARRFVVICFFCGVLFSVSTFFLVHAIMKAFLYVR